MAKFENSMKILLELEFNSPDNALEWNKTENGYTYMGIYEVAHPTWSGWDIIRQKREQYQNLKECSRRLYEIDTLTEKVYDFYYAEFWKPYRLNEIKEQHKSDEIFIFGVNTGMKKAIKIAQGVVGVEIDGIIGSQTIKAINDCDYSFFDTTFDDKEIEYYKAIVQSKPNKSIFLNGWINRAEEV